VDVLEEDLMGTRACKPVDVLFPGLSGAVQAQVWDVREGIDDVLGVVEYVTAVVSTVAVVTTVAIAVMIGAAAVEFEDVVLALALGQDSGSQAGGGGRDDNGLDVRFILWGLWMGWGEEKFNGSNESYCCERE
jgi:hypothetical protein